MFAGGRGEGVAPSAGGECYVGAAPPDPSPGGRADGRGRGGAARRRVPGEGGERRGGRGFPTSPPPPAPATPGRRGRGACRDSPFVRRGAGRSSGRGLCPRLAGRPLPGLARRSYRGPGPSAAAAASSSGLRASLLARARAAAAARRAQGPSHRERSVPGAAGARSRSGRGRPGPGRPFILLGVAAAAPPAGAGGEAGGGEPAGVGFQAVSHGPLPPHAHPSRPAGPRDGCPPGTVRDPENPKRSALTRALPEERRKGDSEAEPGARRRPAGLPSPSRPGRGGELGTWKRRGARGDRAELGAHPSRRGRLRRWASQGPRMEQGPRPAEREATCRPLGPFGLGIYPSTGRKDQILEVVTATLHPKLGVRQGRPPTAAKPQPPPAPS